MSIPAITTGGVATLSHLLIADILPGRQSRGNESSSKLEDVRCNGIQPEPYAWTTHWWRRLDLLTADDPGAKAR